MIQSICVDSVITPRTLSAVIYGERYENVNFFDYYDQIRAELGYDPSVGLCQVKVSTAIWLLSGKDSVLSQTTLPSRHQLVALLQNDSCNLDLALQYLTLIKSEYSNVYGFPPDITQLAAIYSRGIDFGKKVPAYDYRNSIGDRAHEFFESSRLRHIFPR